MRILLGLVEECLRKVPSGFHMEVRDPKNDVRIGGDTVYVTTLAGLKKEVPPFPIMGKA